MRQFGQVPKGYVQDTHRLCSPQQTFSVISQRFAELGITRIADITGLDRLGIPVCTAVRPLSLALSTSQGKGLTLIEAKVSAAMESLEAYHAERPTLQRQVGSFHELSRQEPALNPRTLNQVPASLYHDDLPIEWVHGYDLISDSDVLVPYDLVHTHYLVQPVAPLPSFLQTSNGLASGNHIVEAICHAIYEVVERDAFSLQLLRSLGADFDGALVDPASLEESPLVGKTVEKIRAAGLTLVVREETSDCQIPVFGAWIDEPAPRGFASVGAAEGHGCHLDPEIALVRAITEAAQSRVTAISGARDDLFRSRYAVAKRGALAQQRARAGYARRFKADAAATTDRLDLDLTRVLDRLRAVGFKQVVVVDLTRPELGIAVVRVIIPEMEFLGPSAEFPRFGRRGQAVLRSVRG